MAELPQASYARVYDAALVRLAELSRARLLAVARVEDEKAARLTAAILDLWHGLEAMGLSAVTAERVAISQYLQETYGLLAVYTDPLLRPLLPSIPMEGATIVRRVLGVNRRALVLNEALVGMGAVLVPVALSSTVSPTLEIAAPPTTTADFTTPVTLVAGQLVAQLNGQLARYNAGSVAFEGTLLGVALNTANPDQTVQVQESGLVTVPGWGLTTDATYFAGPNGSLVTSDAGLAFSQIIGLATAPDTLNYNPQPIYTL